MTSFGRSILVATGGVMILVATAAMPGTQALAQTKGPAPLVTAAETRLVSFAHEGWVPTMVARAVAVCASAAAERPPMQTSARSANASPAWAALAVAAITCRPT